MNGSQSFRCKHPQDEVFVTMPQRSITAQTIRDLDMELFINGDDRIGQVSSYTYHGLHIDENNQVDQSSLQSQKHNHAIHLCPQKNLYLTDRTAQYYTSNYILSPYLICFINLELSICDTTLKCFV